MTEKEEHRARKDQFAIEWAQTMENCTPNEVVGNLILNGAEIRDSTLVSPDDDFFNPTLRETRSGGGAFSLIPHPLFPGYGIVSFEMGLKKALITSSLGAYGSDTLIYDIPYPSASTYEDTFAENATRIDPTQSIILRLRQDQVERVCKLIGINLPSQEQ